MKENLIKKSFDTQRVNGTFSLKENRTFFGSKMMEIEDSILIDNRTIQYSDMENGYQYYDFDTQGSNEKIKLKSLNNLKEINNLIELAPQSVQSLNNNTIWNLYIDQNKILKEYLFYKIKERRTFKSIQESNFMNKNIDLSIKEYIGLNLMDRYKYKKANLYVKYDNLTDNLSSNSLLKFNPLYNSLVYDPMNLVENINVTTNKNIVDKLKIIYNQTKNPNQYKFDYYYTLEFEKI